MGWRDINMNRRRPQPRVAFVAVEPGTDRTRAVLRKAAASAVAAASEQVNGEDMASPPASARFMAGYLLGFARQRSSADGVDCAALPPASGSDLLTEDIARAAPPSWKVVVEGLGSDGGRQREAGMLVGRLDAVCGSGKLLRQARARMAEGGAAAARAYLTDCDIAADPMQTRLPTLSLRFHGDERDTILAAFPE